MKSYPLLQLFAGTFFCDLDSKHFTGIEFCVLFWAWSNLMIFIVVSPTNKYLRKLIFAVLEQIAKFCNTNLSTIIQLKLWPMKSLSNKIINITVYQLIEVQQKALKDCCKIEQK